VFKGRASVTNETVNPAFNLILRFEVANVTTPVNVDSN